MKYIVLVLAVVFVLPHYARAQSFDLDCDANEIWFSNVSVIEHDQIRMYAVLRNDSGYELYGRGEFLVDGQLVAEPEFYAISDHCISIWADWTATPGEHQMTARVVNPDRVIIGQTQTQLDGFEQSITASLTVDLDNDGDGISNPNDPDDDNDGLVDSSESSHGTDPFNPDTDRDGVKDGDEVRSGSDPLDSNSLFEEDIEEKEVVNEVLEQTGETNQNAETGEAARTIVLEGEGEEAKKESENGFQKFVLNVRDTFKNIFSNESSPEVQGEDNNDQPLSEQQKNPLRAAWIVFFVLLIIGILMLLLGKHKERR